MTESTDDYLVVNRAMWDERVPHHAASEFYDLDQWVADRPGPRAWEHEFLPDLAGLDAVHLQCHFGLDTLQLAHGGVATVTGLDFSPAAIAQARAVAESVGLGDRATFVESDVYRAVEVLGPERFDLVYVSLGALCWLPSVDRWAEQVAGLLRPGGSLYLHDGHPLSWALADSETSVEHTYFEEAEAFVEDNDSTYTDSAGTFENTRAFEWNHSIGEIVSAVLAHGLHLDRLVEHDWTVWARFPWLEQTGDGRWVLPANRTRLPMTFTLTASKPRFGQAESAIAL